MFNYKVATFFSLIAFLLPLPALAEWLPLPVEAIDGSKIFVESNSMVRKGKYSTVTVGTFYVFPETDGTIMHYSYDLINCRTRQRQTQRLIGYNVKKQVTFDYKYNEWKDPPQPGSPGALIQKIVCN